MRVLIVKLGAIGDVIMAIPAAHALYEAGHAVDWVAGEPVGAILRCYPWINVVVADERSILRGSVRQRVGGLLLLWRQIAGRRYDRVFTLYYDPRYRLLALPVRAARKVMLSTTDRRYQLLAGRHHTDEYARILLELPDRYRPEDPDHLSPVRPLGLPVGPLAHTAKARVVLAPAGARNLMRDDALRRWPPERYADLARLLLAHGLEVVLIGGPDDRWICPVFAGMDVTDRIGQLSLVETLALLDEADVLVTHDTGPLHLGGITRVGIVSVFGPTDPRGRLPQRPGTLAIWGGERLPCRPCYDGRDFAPCPTNECMRLVPAELVLARVLTMVTDRSDGPAIETI